MLAYFDTSAHDVQALRETYARTPASEFAEWAITRGIFQREGDGNILRGPQWGNPRLFCESNAEFRELMSRTPALYGLETAGPRPSNDVTRQTRINQAVARATIQAELDLDQLQKIANFRVLTTEAADKNAHLISPEAGARLSPESRVQLAPERRQVQIVASDGLSALAVEQNLPELLPVLLDGLKGRGISMGRPIAARYGRVKLAEPIADLLEPDLVVFLLGERPGGDALASRSLSAYLVYRLKGPSRTDAARFSGNPTIRFEYTVISNIHPGGLSPIEAGAVILEKIVQILANQAAGNRLAARLA